MSTVSTMPLPQELLTRSWNASLYVGRLSGPSFCQVLREVFRAANLTASRLGEPAGSDNIDGADLEIEFLVERALHGNGQLVSGLAVGFLLLGDDDDLLATERVIKYPQRHSPSRFDTGTTIGHVLDIVRVEVFTANNDQILDSA